MYDKFNRGKEDKFKPSINDPPDLCLRNLERVLMRCEETNLVISWEKCHFMIQEKIVLGQKISRDGIEVDRAVISTFEKRPPPTLVRAIHNFLSHVGFYQRFIQDSEATRNCCSI